MKSQKGMGYFMLIVWIVIIIFIVAGAIFLFNHLLQNQIIETYKTDMLLIQGRIKVLSEETIVKENEELLIGRKITDSLELEEVKNLLEKQVISQDEEDFENYYVLDKSNLEQMELPTIRLKKGYYIVNYQTDEIIYSQGITVGNDTHYKLSELEELNKQENKEGIEENI